MTEHQKQTETPPALPSLIEPDDSSVPGNNASKYKYRDFSKVTDDEIEQTPAAPETPQGNSRGAVESSIRVQKFPVKLYAILAQKEFHDIITWMPHGRAWKVLKPSLFESLVMPLFFEYSNYHSFNRLVNAWSFRRISSGPDRGAYYHELFLRGKPHLQKFMRRLPKTHKKLPMDKQDEPDFYAMDKANPLPSLADAPLPSTAMLPQMKKQRALGAGGGILSSQMMGAMGGGMAAFAEPRDALMGVMGQVRGTSPFAGGAMGMSAMSPMAPMRPMSSMGVMNGMGAMAGMGPMNAMGAMGGLGFGGMNTMNGINSAGFGAGADLEFQRLRQLQQMQLLERQMGGKGSSVGGLSNDAVAMNLRMGRQPC